jgi:hypothetical protein
VALRSHVAGPILEIATAVRSGWNNTGPADQALYHFCRDWGARFVISV